MRGLTTRFTGLLLVALGVWGGLVPFVGHYFHFAMGPDKAWSWTMGRLWLDVLPGAVTVLGGLNLMSAGPRRSARLGALLALAGGIWFAIGPDVSQLWTTYGAQGAAHGSAHIRMLEMLTYHTGLGVIVTALAAYALPRFPVAAVEAAAAERWHQQPGAERWREQPGEPVTDEPVGRRHHRGAEVAAAGAGAAGGVALAHHEERKHERADEAASEPVARDHHRGEEAAAAGAGALGGAALAHHEERKHEREAAADRGSAGEAPLVTEPADRGSAGEAPLVTEPADTTIGTGDTTAPAAAQTDEPAAGAPAYSDHQHSVRRRRGGLLSGLLRR